eukprot:Nk52_evm34s152 gene=Nk52_evmTU34s152
MTGSKARVQTLSPETAMRRRKVFSERRTRGTHKLLKYPILFGIAILLLFDMICYIILRAIIYIFENTFIGERKRKLHRKANQARSYEEWRKYSLMLDREEHREEWKTFPESSYYSPAVVQGNLNTLKQLMKDEADNPEKLLKFVERLCMKNVGGIGNYHMYTNTRVGTKYLIHDYVNVLNAAIRNVCENTSIDRSLRIKFCERIERSYGKTALLLSGGATFGWYHLGVIRALHDRGCLPDVVSGTSAGSLLAAMVCVRSDDELREILTPDLYPCCVAFEPWGEMIKKYFGDGTLAENEVWRQKAIKIMGCDMTFEEAYKKTGRALNITITFSGNKHNAPKLLNYVTAPNCLISSAVVASAALPVLLKPQGLLYKEDDGRIVTHESEGVAWTDGGFKNDLPMKELAQTFNCNNFIVSQVNPHIIPYFYWNTGAPGRPNKNDSWRGGFICSYLEAYLKLDLKKWVTLVNQMDLLPEVFGHDISQVFLQETFGETTLTPTPYFWDYFYFFCNPDYNMLDGFFRRAEQYTWPSIAMIETSYKFERTIETCIKTLGAQDTFEKALQKSLSKRGSSFSKSHKPNKGRHSIH